MKEYVKRGDFRENCEIPVVWTDYHSGNYRTATICNKSDSGVYFKTQAKVQAQSDIFIKVLNCDPNESKSSDPFLFYEAKVRWFRELKVLDGHYFGIGAQVLAKSHKVYEPVYQCSMCDKAISFGEINEIDDFVYLCPHCFEKYNCLPNGIIKNNIRNYMLGNFI